MRIPFTLDEINIIQKFYCENGAQFCADKLNRSPAVISKKANQLGLKISKEMLNRLQSKATYKPYDKYKVNPLPFINCNINYIAYILGFIYADGNVYYRNEKGNRESRIAIRCSADDILSIKHLFDLTGKWSFDIYIKENIERASKDVMRVHTSNRILAEYLKDNDYCIKSGASADKILSKIPSELHSYFLLGVIDGDGCWYYAEHPRRNTIQKHRAFNIASCYDQNWTYVENIFQFLNINYKIHRRKSKRGGTSTINVTDKSSINKIFSHLYPNGFEFGLKRKYEKALLCIR